MNRSINSSLKCLRVVTMSTEWETRGFCLNARRRLDCVRIVRAIHVRRHPFPVRAHVRRRLNRNVSLARPPNSILASFSFWYWLLLLHKALQVQCIIWRRLDECIDMLLFRWQRGHLESRNCSIFNSTILINWDKLLTDYIITSIKKYPQHDPNPYLLQVIFKWILFWLGTHTA